MKIAAFCIKHKVTTILVFVMLTIFGLVMFSDLSLALMPDMEIPVSVVITTYPGAGPEDVEELVTRPVESAVASVAGVDTINSTSAENVSSVMIQYADGTDLESASIKLRDKLELLSLPDDCSKPSIMNVNMDMMPVAVIALYGEDLSALQDTATDDIAPALERIDGVASVEIAGGVSQQIAVEVNADRMAGYGLSISYLSSCLSADNILYPAGSVNNGTQTLTVRTDGKFTTLDDVRNLLIPLHTGGTVRLREIASVNLENSEPDAIGSVDGQRCVVLAVNKQSGANAVKVAESVNKAMTDLQQSRASLNYRTVMDQSDYINLSVNNAMQNIVLGVLIAALILFIFLRRFGATLTIAVSMPVCIITVFLLMKIFGLTLNMMSLGGIGMGVGMIVDNSIVVLENIFRYRRDGKPRLEACTEGTQEVSLSIIASTLTTCAVFVPIALSGGMVGMMFKDFALTIAFLILSSLIIALTLVPLMCYYLLGDSKWTLRLAAKQAAKQAAKAAQGKTPLIDRLLQRYRRLLGFFLRRRAVAVLITVALVVVFASSVLVTGIVLLPDMDQSEVDISISLPIGSELEQTEAISDRVSAIAAEQVPELDYLYYQAQNESSSVVLMLVPVRERSRSSAAVARALRDSLQDIAGCEITCEAGSMATAMTGNSSDINVSISGNDYNELKFLSDDLVAQISALPDAIEVQSTLDDAVPQVNIHVDRAKAASYGLTAATIGGAVRSELTGTTASQITMNGTQLDVVIRGDSIGAQSLDALKSVSLATSTGGSVPLSEVAGVDVEMAPQSIARTNQSRAVTITGRSASGNSTGIAAAVSAITGGYQLPDGYHFSTDSSYDSIVESFTSLLKALIVAIGLVYFILASQFESFAMPIIIMMILPIAFAGGLFGLPLTGNQVSMVALIGIIMLAGVVVNSAIVLVDYINIRRGRGEEKNEAILNACPRRVRPVLMTTLTTILGLLPMAFGLGGEGSEMTASMAIVMIAGMITSTIVTLFFTPVYYSLIDSLSHLGARRRQKKQDALAKAAQTAE